MNDIVEKTHSLVCIEDSKLTCFCRFEDWQKHQYKCRSVYNCPEAFLDVTVLPLSRPSDAIRSELTTPSRKISAISAEVHKSASQIKQGVLNLEKALKNSRFKI